MTFKFSNNSTSKLDTCETKIKIVLEKALELSSIDFGVSHGHRTPQEQKTLFEKGRTKPGSIVTYCDGYAKKSKHNASPSLAVDIYAFVDGKASWEAEHLSYIAGIILTVAKFYGIPLVWGGH